MEALQRVSNLIAWKEKSLIQGLDKNHYLSKWSSWYLCYCWDQARKRHYILNTEVLISRILSKERRGTRVIIHHNEKGERYPGPEGACPRRDRLGREPPQGSGPNFAGGGMVTEYRVADKLVSLPRPALIQPLGKQEAPGCGPTAAGGQGCRRSWLWWGPGACRVHSGRAGAEGPQDLGTWLEQSVTSCPHTCTADRGCNSWEQLGAATTALPFLQCYSVALYWETVTLCSLLRRNAQRNPIHYHGAHI